MLNRIILNFFLLANVLLGVSAEDNLTPGSLSTFRKAVTTQYYSKEYEQVPWRAKIAGQIIRSVPLNACSEISIDTIDALTPPILIAVKGECEFSIKTLNAKLVGAKLLIIVDDDDIELGDYGIYDAPIKSERVHTDTVTILEMEDEDAVDYVLISKTSGQKIIEAIEEVNEAETGSFIEGAFYFNKKYDENAEIGYLEWQEHIYYEIQVQPSQRRSIEFLKEFQEYYDLLQGSSSIKIHFLGITTGGSKYNCICGKRYCSETEGDLFNSGAEVVLENLRHLCIMQQYDLDTWWQYMSGYGDYCLDDTNIQECSARVLRKINLDPIEVESCMRTSFDQNNYQDCTYNPLLEEILDISSSLSPNVIIGDTIWPTGDLLSAKGVFEAICHAFNEMPQVCQSHYSPVTHSKHAHNASSSSYSSRKHSESQIPSQTSSSNSSNSESPPFISAPQSNLTEPLSSQNASKPSSQSLDSNSSSNQHSAQGHSRPKTVSIQPSTKKSSASQILHVNSSVLKPALSNSSISTSPNAKSSSQTTLLSNGSNQTHLQPALSGPSSSESSSQEPPQLKSSDSASSASQASSLPKDPIQGPSLNDTDSQNSSRSQSFQTNGSLSSETSTGQNISSPGLPNSVSLPSSESSSQNSSIPNPMNPGILSPETTSKNSSVPVVSSVQSESPGVDSSIVSNYSSTQTLSQNSSSLNNSALQPSPLVPYRGPSAILPQNSSFSNTTLSGSPDLEPSSRGSSESESSLSESPSNQTSSLSNSSSIQTLPQQSPTSESSSQERIGIESSTLNSASKPDIQASSQNISTTLSQNSSLSGPAVPQSSSAQANDSSEGSSALQASAQESPALQSSSLNSSSPQTLPSTSQIANSTLNTSSPAQTLSQGPLSSAVSPSQPLQNGPSLSEPSSSGTSSLQPLSQESQASGQNSSLADPSSTQALPQDSSVPPPSAQQSSISDTSTSEPPSSETVSSDASSDATSAAEPTGSVSSNGLNSHSFAILISVVCVVATGLLILILYKSPFISTTALTQWETGSKPSGAEYVALEGNISERLDHQNAVLEDNLV